MLEWSIIPKVEYPRDAPVSAAFLLRAAAAGRAAADCHARPIVA
jgi:hypothetical protein